LCAVHCVWFVKSACARQCRIYRVSRDRERYGVRIAKSSMVWVVNSFNCQCMFVGCDERLICLGVGKISKLKWGKRGACKCSIGGRRKEGLSLFCFFL
jgi:hypothetical protein